MFPENQTGFEVRGSIDSRQNLSHDQVVDSGSDGREVSLWACNPGATPGDEWTNKQEHLLASSAGDERGVSGDVSLCDSD